jgi:hypothetical protein
MAVAPHDRSRWPSLLETHEAGMSITGTCGHCVPPRHIEADMASLIERLGAEVKTRDVMKRMTCSVCGTKVFATLVPVKSH